MNKVVVSVLGEDRPGIVYSVSKVLGETGCDILEVSQTILQTEFAGIFIAAIPADLTQEGLVERLEDELAPKALSAWVKEFKAPQGVTPVESEPYVITLRGPDQKGIIPNFTGVIAGFDVNIENLKAIPLENDTRQVVIAFEVAVPTAVHRPAFREALRFKADELDLELSVQHRDIFEAIHRI